MASHGERQPIPPMETMLPIGLRQPFRIRLGSHITMLAMETHVTSWVHEAHGDIGIGSPMAPHGSESCPSCSHEPHGHH